MKKWMIYGANGYTGRLISQEAKKQGLRNSHGRKIEKKIQTGHAYDLTAYAAVQAVKRVLDGKVKSGFQTPSSAFGANFVLQLEGVSELAVRL